MDCRTISQDPRTRGKSRHHHHHHHHHHQFHWQRYPVELENINGQWGKKNVRKGSKVNENGKAYTPLFVEPAPSAVLSDYGQFSKLLLLKTCLAYYWNEDETDDRGSDLRRGDLSIRGRYAAFRLTIDRPGVSVSRDGQLPSRTRHSLPRIDKSSCRRSEPQKSYNIILVTRIDDCPYYFYLTQILVLFLISAEMKAITQ